MAKKWVLIVDDHRDVRQVLHSGLATLDPELNIVDVPSGEEAMLLVLFQPPDLMVVDINLPGISGLDLLKRARARNPDLKLILITGMVDRKTRQQVTDSGAQAHFYKPVPMREFLQTARELLQLIPEPAASRLAAPPAALAPQVEPEPAPIASAAPPSPPAWAPVKASTPAERLGVLLERVGARAALLLDGRGQVLQQVGSRLLVDGLEASLLQAVVPAARVSALLGKDAADHLQYFNGKLQSVILTPIHKTRFLVLVLLPGLEGERLAEALLSARQAARDLADLLPATAPLPQALAGEAPPAGGPLPSLEDLFGATLGDLKDKDVDAFWDSALAASEGDGQSADMLSFDEARRLGLGLDDEGKSLGA